MENQMDALSLTEKTTIWREISDHLIKRYDVIYAANLLHYDYCMNRLHQQLQVFQNHKFKENQRMVFSLYDTQYYLSGNNIGFTIENLVRTLENLDLSFAYCYLFTNHHGIGNEVSRRCGKFPIKVFENNFSTLLTTVAPVIMLRTSDQIQKKFCFMSNFPRDHRSYIRLWIEDKKIDREIMLSWHPPNLFAGKVRQETTYGSQVRMGDVEFLYTIPFTRNNDKIPCNSYLEEIYHKHRPVLDEIYRDEDILTAPNHKNFEAPWLSKVFLNIVAETVFDYPYPYLTEKTFKCFWHRSPFILVGAVHSLKYLKSIGFKTFDRWIDETYDTIVDPTRRLGCLLETLDTVSKWSLDHCRDIYNEMTEVLEHNLQHYQTHFCEHMLNKTTNNI